MNKKSIKLDSFCWIAENGVISYGFWFGDSDEPVEFTTTIKEIVRNTLESHRLGNGEIERYCLEDMIRLSLSLQAAKNLIDHEVKRMEGIEYND